ncbi:MAG: signal peptidase I [Beduini sp.]|uniref:signal peptidase I n=1 Tax=Beduini sp. TaxID=1922300 RepID=UPI0011CA7B9B
MKRLIQKFITILLSLLIGLLMIILGVQTYNKFILHDETANIFGFNYRSVLTGSMEPTLPVGSMAFTKEQKQYAVNDIVMFEEDGVIITHRIIEQNNDHFITKGDANNTPDEKEITQEQIMGSVIMAIPYIGYLYIWLKSPIGIICLFVICAIWYIWTGRNRGAEDETEEK